MSNVDLLKFYENYFQPINSIISFFYKNFLKTLKTLLQTLKKLNIIFGHLFFHQNIVKKVADVLN
jgi:hypothetical protein